MNPAINLPFESGYLRPISVSDIYAQYFHGLNDPEVNKYLFAVKSTTQTLESATHFVNDNLKSSNAVLFGIWINDNKNFCGTIRVHGIDKQFGTAHLGICIFDKQYWGQGIGANAIGAVCEWCFNTINLRWIEAGLFSENCASKKTFINSGFKFVCEYPDKYLLEGKPSPVEVYAKRN